MRSAENCCFRLQITVHRLAVLLTVFWQKKHAKSVSAEKWKSYEWRSYLFCVSMKFQFHNTRSHITPPYTRLLVTPHSISCLVAFPSCQLWPTGIKLLKKHRFQLSHTISAHIHIHTIPSEITVGDRHGTTLHTVTRQHHHRTNVESQPPCFLLANSTCN